MKLIYLFITIFCWGICFFLQKVAVERLKNFILVQIFYAMFSAIFVIFPLTWLSLRRESLVIDRISILIFLVMGLTAVIGNISFFYSLLGNQNSAAYIAASNSYVIFVFIYSMIFLGEQLTTVKLIGLILLLLGAVILGKS